MNRTVHDDDFHNRITAANRQRPSSSSRLPNRPQQIIVRLALSLFLITILASCGGKIIVADSYPLPVVDPLPYRAGIYMSPEFRNYVHVDEDAKLNLELGSKQSALYDQIFQAMFSETRSLNSLTATDIDQNLDIIIEPALQEYAFLSPVDTATHFYAVSMKYQIRLYSESGELIGYWPFVAYGKDRKSFGSGKAALGEATTSALRDAAAAMSSQFHDVVENERWRNPEELNVNSSN